MSRTEQDYSSLAVRVEALENLFRNLFYEGRTGYSGSYLLAWSGYAFVEAWLHTKAGRNDYYVVACGQPRSMVIQKERYEQIAPKAGTLGHMVLKLEAKMVRYARARL